MASLKIICQDRNTLQEDFLLKSYDYDLPPERIAQFPSREPGASRMLVLSRQSDIPPADSNFEELPGHLPEGALLVANNCRVLPARLTGVRDSGGKAEFLLLTPLPLILATTTPGAPNEAFVECLLRPAAKIRPGSRLVFAGLLHVTVLEKGAFGMHRVKMAWTGNLEEIFASHGQMPLPPYIRRQPQKSDALRYQTCYASKTGAVAAPTAGLHFTPQMRSHLAGNGCQWLELTLYVGYGTFSPVRENDIRQHNMHREYVEMDARTARAIREAKAEGRPVVAVGSTSLRALEGIYAANGDICPFNGWTDIFIYPGYKFQVVDGLITNFHLPMSSLLMLVSAFAGREKIMDAYDRAIGLDYNFFSYGDAMLINP